MSKHGKIVVAMSGGVDSSTAACLLKEEGYEVIGVTMHLWPDEPTSGDRCCTPGNVGDARAVAAKMGFPFHLVDFSAEFKRRVIDDFIGGYRSGRTPNPCIRCNEFLKFGVLAEKAREFETPLVATGHYARVQYDPARRRHILLKGIDEKKEQSYFLYALKPAQLTQVNLPLGEYTKDEVRELARDFGLAVSEKKGSQEICFIDERGYADFLHRLVPEAMESGSIKDLAGQVIGRHKGIAAYTVGQRKKLGLPGPQPHYVVEIRPEENTVVVGTEKDVYRRSLVAARVNIIPYEELPAQLDVTAKIRYQMKPAPACVRPRDDGKIEVQFARDVWAITPGQSVVFYQGDLVVGGGVIEKMSLNT